MFSVRRRTLLLLLATISVMFYLTLSQHRNMQQVNSNNSRGSGNPLPRPGRQENEQHAYQKIGPNARPPWTPPPAGFKPVGPVTGWRDEWNSDRPEGAVGGVNLPPFLGPDRGSVDKVRRDTVREMMVHAWSGYVEHAWGQDELKPVQKTGYNWYRTKSMLNTPVDALDTLFIMGLTEEYKQAKELVLANLTYNDVASTINIFETHIRITGGLLSAYDMDGDKRLLEKCVELVDQMLVSFETPNGLSLNHVVPSLNYIPLAENPEAAKAAAAAAPAGSNVVRPMLMNVLLAEVGTLQLELQYLSDVTGDPKYAERAILAFEQLNARESSTPGLYPINMDTYSFSKPQYAEYGLGGRSDSFYEYLLKLWLSTGEERYRRMYLVAAHALADFVVTEVSDTVSNDVINTFAPNVNVYSSSVPATPGSVHRGNYFEHLACFSGGMFALGALSSRRGEWTAHLDIGRRITETCFRSYNRSASGLGPESMGAYSLISYNSHYFLRPETVESLFYMWRFTHDPVYREQGWAIVEALNKYCRAEVGFHGLVDVNKVNPVVPDDLQQSFFLAETLKYLYLLFSDDDVVPLEKYVFNTEAHPISMRGHGRRANPKEWSPLPLQASDFTFRKVGEVFDADGSVASRLSYLNPKKEESGTELSDGGVPADASDTLQGQKPSSPMPPAAPVPPALPAPVVPQPDGSKGMLSISSPGENYTINADEWEEVLVEIGKNGEEIVISRTPLAPTAIEKRDQDVVVPSIANKSDHPGAPSPRRRKPKLQ